MHQTWRTWLTREANRPVVNYGVAVLSVVVATLVRASLDPFLGDLAPYATYYLAVTFCAWFSEEWGPCLLAIVAGGAAGFYFFLPPRLTWQGFNAVEAIMYGVVATVAAAFAGNVRSAHRRAAERGMQLLHEQQQRLQVEAHARQVETSQQVERLKAEFLMTMTHELRTPLNSIIGFTELLLDGVPGPVNAEQRRELEVVRESAAHLLKLVTSILDAARLEAGRMRVHLDWMDVGGAVASVLATLRVAAVQKGIALSAAVPEPAPLVYSDEAKVVQILLNLVGNAVKFTAHGRVDVLVSTGDNHVEIVVQDTGPGIADEDLPLLFEPFRQLEQSKRRHHEGTGLGLYMCRKLAAMLGATLDVRSTIGVGTTFVLRLPLPGGPPLQPGMGPAEAGVDGPHFETSIAQGSQR